MRHLKHTFKVGRNSSHRKAMLANLACSTLLESRIMTTLTKAKEARRLVEKMIGLGKDGSLSARRRAVATLRNKSAVRLLFNDVAKRYTTRPGGYTRIIRVGPRRGDAAEMCFLELLPAPEAAAPATPDAAAEATPATPAQTPQEPKVEAKS